MSVTPNLSMTELVSAQSQPEVPINQDLRRLDTLVQMAVQSIITALPGSPADGDRHIVADAGTTGAAVGHENQIAYYVGGTFNEWRYLAPNPGWLAFVESADKYHYFGGGSPPSWNLLGPGVGLGT